MKIQKLFKSALVVAICLSLGNIFIAPATLTHAADYDVCSDSNVPDSVKAAQGCANVSSNGDVSGVVTGILNAVIGIASLVAVIFIVIGGINYMTSAGDSGKVEKGKKTIIYAAIGLIICALAFAIVNWVVGSALGQGSDNSTSAVTYQLPIA